ncbi:MAG: MBL fold metallo-hydrolase [Methanococcaceae archaeon]
MEKIFRLLLLFSLNIILMTISISAQTNNYKTLYSDDELLIKEIDSDTYLVIHTFPWPANSLVIKFNKNNFLFIDTPYTDEATEKLVKWLQKRTLGKIKITAINTHFHVDNLGGNGYLKKIGSVTYGSDLTARLLKQRGLGNGMLQSFKDIQSDKYYTYYQSKELVPPGKLFPISKEFKLFFEKDTIEVWYPGAAHTPDNIVVYYSRKQILFGGCMLKSMESNSKGFLGDADTAAWGNSLEKLLNRFPEAKLVIPGHGNLGGLDLIKHTIEIVTK